ncbi:hypothetical protein HDU98_000557 [Podochytrium sp. JEL0797]|nr:hypothetical protein HDU98_000557 [Podochytrium sp. JEL0797]
MSTSDRAQLLSMGFEEARVDAALKATNKSGLQPAMDWLFAHADQELPAQTEDAQNDDAITEAEATAASLKCDDCGRLLRNSAAAEFHAVKSGHQNFSESTQVIKPLTEEEKKVKLEQLKIKMAEKKEEKRLLEIEENKAKEKVRRTTGKEMVEIKEKMFELEMKKAAAEKKKEKEDDRIFKAKIKAQIELDRKDRAAKLEKDKLDRQGLASNTPTLSTASSSTSIASAAGPKEYTEARLQLRLPSGPPLTHTFPASDPLSVVYDFVAQQTGAAPGSFKLATTFPRKVLEEQGKSLKELGLAPSAALAVV